MGIFAPKLTPAPSYSNKKVFGIGINSGHFIPEQKPQDTIKQLKNFFKNYSRLG